MDREWARRRFFEALYSTDNTQHFLKKVSSRKGIAPDLVEALKSSSKKTYKVKKISKTTFELKLSNGRWAKFEMGEVGGMKIGNRQVPWQPLKSISENLTLISSVLREEYPDSNAAFSLFPRAHAVEVYNPDEVAIGAAGSALQSAWEVTTFLDGAEHVCDHGSLPPAMSVGSLLNGNLKGRDNPYMDREWARRRFFEARNHFTNQTTSEWLIHRNIRYVDDAFDRFYKVQDCFLNKLRHINATEVKEHPQHPIPEAYR